MSNRKVLHSLRFVLALTLGFALLVGMTVDVALAVSDPSLQLEKTTCTDAALTNCSDTLEVAPGAKVYWKYVVRNTGAPDVDPTTSAVDAEPIPLNGFTLIDNNGTPNDDSDDLKYPGAIKAKDVSPDPLPAGQETWIFYAEGTAKQLNGGTYENAATASHNVNNEPLSSTDESSYKNSEETPPPVEPGQPAPKPVPIPEPITVVLFGTGLAALSAAAARRKKTDTDIE